MTDKKQRLPLVVFILTLILNLRGIFTLYLPSAFMLHASPLPGSDNLPLEFQINIF
jgi:hypothetical protein